MIQVNSEVVESKNFDGGWTTKTTVIKDGKILYELYGDSLSFNQPPIANTDLANVIKEIYNLDRDVLER